MRNDAEVQNAVRSPFVGVAPERESELFELWKQYSLRFNILTNTGPDGFIVFGAGAYRDVRFKERAMRAFWLASFIAWEGYRAIAEGYGIDNIDLTRFRDMVDCFNRILTEEDPDAIALPEGIPDPGDLPNKEKKPQMRAAAELAMFATGWAFLHGVRHLRHQQEETGAAMADPPERWREEELSCDLYATQFLLDRGDEYARAAGESVEKVRQEREIGILYGDFCVKAPHGGPCRSSRMVVDSDLPCRPLPGCGSRTGGTLCRVPQSCGHMLVYGRIGCDPEPRCRVRIGGGGPGRRVHSTFRHWSAMQPDRIAATPARQTRTAGAAGPVPRSR